ncbi:IMP-specific 5'-nucleotidase 1 [Sporothrix brasiliensis 5110]|uniref:IMP-specific 5'-nucleotidase 1 n=1 Tax=Sporothrix brasiliensis 5110 TaxID=1398154 RepID=A0A0C2IRB5_9PEZI|nr:IMP-specific 5'-nucleotidase 1 [Sporothrix brasiliensis 5110]KIH87557.1 IMP-specific 5'-nucleotidase 1 [Sporothrix brasiliensis 5110]
MTSKYRVEYALKSHRRDQLIEWVKGLLISPFVLFSQPAGDFEDDDEVFASNTAEVRRRYAEIMRDIEAMIDEHRLLQDLQSLETPKQSPRPSRLQMLVPTAGPFFTALPLEAAFMYQDARRHISSRRLVPPSFNDVRLTLNTAQLMALTATSANGTRHGRNGAVVARSADSLQLVTFDGDLTLYADGQNLEPDSPIIPRIMALLRRNIKVGIVTAAGYDAAEKYYERLHGLLDAVHTSTELSDAQKHSLLVVGGEASFVFSYSATAPPNARLAPVDPADWMPDAMKQWPTDDLTQLLDLAETTLRACVDRMQLPAQILRKARAVGMIPLPRKNSQHPNDLIQIARESLEEIVLTVQKRLEVSPAGRAGRVPFCAFNGGRDVFVDIGDKSWGVLICQHALLFLGKPGMPGSLPPPELQPEAVARPGTTLHVGDQFLSAGANDFRARRAATTAWVANPLETEALLDELLELIG